MLSTALKFFVLVGYGGRVFFLFFLTFFYELSNGLFGGDEVSTVSIYLRTVGDHDDDGLEPRVRTAINQESE